MPVHVDAYCLLNQSRRRTTDRSYLGVAKTRSEPSMDCTDETRWIDAIAPLMDFCPHRLQILATIEHVLTEPSS